MKSKTKKTARRPSGSLLVRRWKREAIELRREVAAVTQYAKSIAVHMARHWSDTAPHWKPFDDIGGILTQIDNMAAGMMRRPPNDVSSAASLTFRQICESGGPPLSLHRMVGHQHRKQNYDRRTKSNNRRN